MAQTPPIEFAPARGARIAYQYFGEGDATIVSIPPMAQNIEMAWERPETRRMFERFGSFSRFLHFDKRGTGASDKRSHVPGIDERVDDLRAVMDHAAIDRAHFFVSSEGGPMAILFAATYPQRVESLTLWGSGASMMPAGMTDEERAARIEVHKRFAAVWGTPESRVVDRFAPSLAADQDFRNWHQRYERAAATTHSLLELLALSLDMDVREVLPEIDHPTLVLHRVDDMVVPIAFGREVAAGIRNAKLVELDGKDHFSYVGEIDTWMAELELFVTGNLRDRPPRQEERREIRILTLGRFAVVIDGQEVAGSTWGSRRARQLLKRLVAARGWPVTRDELIEMLWPNESDRHRLGARLSVQLSAVRRVLGGGVIADRQSVRLDLDEVATDLEDFYSATDDNAIVAAYNGEFLPDDVYDDWTGAVRDEVRSRFVTTARKTAAKYAEEGHHLPAIELARQLVQADKFDENAHQLVVDNLVAVGEMGEAKRAHKAWADAMAELEVDVPPFGS